MPADAGPESPLVAADDPAPTVPSAQPPRAAPGSFEPAQQFAADSKLSLYHYHTHRIGNSEGYLAPIIATRDGGFLVVGTRSTSPPGRYQVGSSRPVVVKLDAKGSKVWEHAYPARGFLDYEGGSAVEVEDGYIVYILSYVHPSGGSVVRLVRIDRDGEVVWDLRLRGDGRAGTPHPQTFQLRQGKLFMEGHIYKDASETAYGWRGTVSLDGKVLSDDVGAANPYR